MKTTPKGIPYDKFFENLLKSSVSPTSQVKRSVENKKLWFITSNEKNNILFYGYDLGLNKSSTETVI